MITNIRSIMLNKFTMFHFYDLVISLDVLEEEYTYHFALNISCYVYVLYFKSLWLFELLNHRKQNIFWKHDTIYVHNQCVCLELELGLFLIIHHNQHIIHLYCLFYYSIQVNKMFLVDSFYDFIMITKIHKTNNIPFSITIFILAYVYRVVFIWHIDIYYYIFSYNKLFCSNCRLLQIFFCCHNIFIWKNLNESLLRNIAISHRCGIWYYVQLFWNAKSYISMSLFRLNRIK